MPRMPKFSFFRRTNVGDGFFFFRNKKVTGKPRLPIFTYNQLNIRREK